MFSINMNCPCDNFLYLLLRVFDVGLLLRAIPAIEGLLKNGTVSDVPARADRTMKAQMLSGTVVIDGQPRVLGAIVRTDETVLAIMI